MILTDEVVNYLTSIDQRAVINTYNLISTVIPKVSRTDNSLIISSERDKTDITYFDQSIFEIITEFTYVPLWYVYREIKKENIHVDPIEKIRLWRDLGIVFIDSQTNGDFLRPTNYLYNILNKTVVKYKTIPYNMLSHDVSKMDIYFKSICGKSDEIMKVLDEELGEEAKNLIIKPDNYLKINYPIDSENQVLNLLEGEKVNIPNRRYFLKAIDESQIKISKNNEAKISQIENKILESIKRGDMLTFELKEHQGFFSAVVEGKMYILQFPDLIIPLKRDEETGKPNSIAIEMELTSKPLANYEKNLLKYKNSIKFGSVVWFCGSTLIKNRIYEAYKNIGGTGFTSIYTYEYDPPRRQEIEILTGGVE